MSLDFEMNLDTGGFTNPLSGARNAVGGFKSGVLSTFSQIGSAITGLESALNLLRPAFQQAFGAIGDAAEIEMAERQLTTLLGTADAARARLADLSEFNLSTPFELQDLIEASKVLQTFSGDALSAGQGLRMVADSIAAVSNNPGAIKENAIWFGRLYDTLMNNRPAGEALARLQELAIINGKVRGQIEAMQKANLSGAEIWQYVTTQLQKFEGASEGLADTFVGRMSNLKESWNELRREFGRPIVTALKPLMVDLTEFAGTFREEAQKFGQKVADYITDLRALFEFGGFEAVGQKIKLDLMEAANSAVRALISGLAGVGAVLRPVFNGLLASLGELSKSSFWQGMSRALEQVVIGLKATMSVVLSDLGKALVDMGFGQEGSALMGTANKIAEDNLLRVQEMERNPVKGVPLTEIFAENLPPIKAAIDAYKKASEEAAKVIGDVIPLEEQRKEVLKLLEDARKNLLQATGGAASDGDPAKPPAGAMGAARGGSRESSGEALAAISRLEPLSDNFARVGLFLQRGFAGRDNEAARTTARNTERMVSALDEIKRNTARPASAEFRPSWEPIWV